MSILFRVCAIINLILAIVSIIVQSVILAKYTGVDDPPFSRTAVGIWAGIVLLATGIALLICAIKSDCYRVDLASVILCILSILVCIAMIALSSVVIQEINEVLSYDIVFEFLDEFIIRRSLEKILLSCAIVAFIINVLALIFFKLSYSRSAKTICQQP